ncbi:Crp/Fnr family transcriptional regulator [Mycobacterium sp. CBMA226]|nr:Crp/Fnr family transcriptional regulator [Mycolicibacterium sp. CBMA 226]
MGMGVQPSDLHRNAVLATLDASRLDRLLPHIQIDFSPIGHVAQRAGNALSHIHFPLDSVYSVLAESQHGVGIEVGTVGSEGLVGIAGHLGARNSRQTVVCWCAGDTAYLPVDEFLEETTAAGPWHDAIDRFTDYLLIQMAQNVLCTSQHSVRARLARWLLAAHDRYDCKQFSSTQESLSQMLGVQRPTISETAARMQREGLIIYRRGNIEIVDRVALRQIACECYRVVDQALTAVREAGPAG